MSGALPDGISSCRLVVVLDQRVNVYALETLEKLCTLETAANPKVHASSMRLTAIIPCMARRQL